MAKINLKAYTQLLPIVLLVIITFWLRLINLGYSDYQGDEVKALSLPSANQGMTNFLLEQRKGPVQFTVTYLIKLVHPSYSNEFLTRLPFALAGCLSIFFFYKVVRLHFGRKIALYATLFLTTNGILIGLTRIVQYQPFVILFSILSLYLFSLALEQDKWKITGMYAGMLSWALALLSHFDGIFIAPFVAYILYRWYKKYSDLSKLTRIKHLIISSAICGLLLSAFYIPFLFSISEETKSYWSIRIALDKAMSDFSSSVANFELYNPLIVFYIYVIVGCLSLFKIKKAWPVLLWFIFPWVMYELIFFDPGTHIYTYLIPATILIAFGVVVIEEIVVKIFGGKYGRLLNIAGLSLVFAFLASLSHFIFVDHTPEYPWEERRYLFWTISKPDTEAHLWIFGFPYYRHWEAIGDFITSTENNGYYSTNENKSIASYYTPYIFNYDNSGYYIHIYNPQSFRDKLADDKIRYWRRRYQPVKVFENQGGVVAEIYIMPEGDINDIREAGY
jgi:4-amino-4-deoxy-L-arabinose transferase-like glycosyltransferase